MRVQLNNMPNVPKKYRNAFYKAATHLAKIIVGPASGYPKSLTITVTVKEIDRVGNTLGYAYPENVVCYPINCYAGQGLPSHGRMVFDSADLDEMVKDKTLFSVVFHEMLHVCGLGTIWEGKKLVKDLDTNNPVYVGEHALAEYRKLTNNPSLTSIPLENEGGAGTRNVHWRQKTFGNEVFIGVTTGEFQPISRMTIAALEDLGYVVDYSHADPYKLINTEGLSPANDDHYDLPKTENNG